MADETPDFPSAAQKSQGARAGGRDHTGAAPSSRGSFLRWLFFVAKVAVSLLLLWFLFTADDLDKVAGRLANIAPGFLVLGFLVESLGIFLAAWRWRIVLAAIGVRIGFASALQILFIGLFLNQVLPSTLGGDAMRAWRLFKRGSSVGHAVRGVMLDRVVALVGLAFLVALGLPFVLSLTGDRVAYWILWGIVVAVLSGLAVLLVVENLLAPLKFGPHALYQGLSALSRDARRLFLVPRRAGLTLALSVLIHAATVLSVFVLALGMGISVSAIECLVLLPPVILLSALPVSLAGWGVREGAMIAAMGFVGVLPSAALALSVMFGLIVVASSLPGAAIWILSGEKRS